MMSKEVIPLQDVAKLITDFTNKDFERAIVLMMLQGMKAKNILNLKIIDLLNSCNSYFEDEEITLEKMLNKDPIAENMIAFWDISDKKPHFLCSGPQALFFILRHLQSRIDKGELQIDETDDYLLVNTTFTQLDKDYVTDWLTPSFRKKLRESGITAEITGGNLIHTFDTICKNHLPQDQFKKSTIKLFKGKDLSRKEDRSYKDEILNDNTILINQFKEILPYLTVDIDYDSFTSNTIQDSIDNTPDTHNPQEKNHSNDELYFFIKDYYKNHIQDGPIENYEEYDFIVDYVYGLTVDHVSLDYFEPEKQMPRLFKRAELELLFKNQAISIKYNDFDSSDALFKEVMNVIYDSGASSIVPIVEDTFKEVFFSSLYNNHQYEFEYGKDIIITSADILDSLHAYGI